MRAIHVNFAPHSPARVLAAMRPAHWLLAAVGLVMCAGGVLALRDFAQRQEVRQTALAQIKVQAAVRSAPVAELKKLEISEAQAIAVNSVIAQLNLPWSSLLTAIEHATPASVAMLELEPDAKRHLVRGVAETSTAGMMLAYIKRLKMQPFVGNVILTKHEVSDKDSNELLRFEFEVEWLEAVE